MGLADIRFIIFRSFIATQWFFWGHLTCFASRVKAAYNGSFGGRGNKARLSISSLRSEAAGVTSLGVNQCSFRNQQVENSPGLRNAL